MNRNDEVNNFTDIIREDIVMKKYQCGEKITELQLAQAYGIKRNTARNILQQLHYEGMVEFLDNGCKQISGFDQNDAKKLYALRKHLETTAVIEILSQETINYTPLIEFLDKTQNVKSDSVLEYIKRDIDFHRSVIAMANDRYLLSAYNSIAPTLYSIFKINIMNFDKSYTNNYHERHSALIKLIIAGNQEECVNEFSAHVDNALSITLNILNKIDKL